ncbi:MAG: sn-glycerol-3-phosphate ABC transporter ATP-binding protein UgpC [Oceanospirillaceae bacterium]
MSGLKLSAVKKSFGNVEIIKGVDLTIKDGEFIVFVGPSGCGKSTLLRTIAGLEDLSAGSIEIGDRVVNHIDAAKRGIAMVFQSYALYPHKTVRENMAFGLKMNRIEKNEADRRIQHAAQILQLDSLLERKPKQLSGGQRQRVAIGRAIVREPEVFLFDEPLSNLDAELRVEMRVQLTRLHRRLNATMIYVTHDQVEAMTMADRIVVLRDGRIEQVGSPMHLYKNPCNKFVAGFLGSPKMNFLEAIITHKSSQNTQINLPGDICFNLPFDSSQANVGDKVTLGIRPSDLVISTSQQPSQNSSNTLQIIVDVSEHLGGQTIVYGSFLDTTIIAEVDKDMPLDYQQTLNLQLPIDKCHLFDEQGLAMIRAAENSATAQG